MKWTKVDEALKAAAFPYDEAPSKKEDWKSLFKSGNYVFPGAVLLVGRRGEILYHQAVGCRSVIPELTPMSENMVFDVASLTKVLVPTTLAMKLVDSNQLSLDRRVSRIIQSFGTYGKERITIKHLLTHSSGYAATYPFYHQIARADGGERAGVMSSRGAAEMVYNEIYRAKLENLPGKVARYSDIGFILLGDTIEILYGGAHLDKLAHDNIFVPLNLRSTGYVDLSKLRMQGMEVRTDIIVPTAECSWRKKLICGEVHDDNAWAMGGVSAHAGVFSTALDLHKFASEMLKCYAGKGSLISQNTLRSFWKLDGSVPDSSWAMGWDTPTPGKSSSGRYFSSQSVGHLGYTGCSMWIDPATEVDVILLSNRIHPTTENEEIKLFRPFIHDLVMETLGLAR
ncbi:MAG: beta-lactamase family protein [Deltaproteobacteria bacterium]|nr:beta-lactamase family protein [Deltaproteobacteria bacterium]